MGHEPWAVGHEHLKGLDLKLPVFKTAFQGFVSFHRVEFDRPPRFSHSLLTTDHFQNTLFVAHRSCPKAARNA